MNGIEVEAWNFKHNFSRTCPDTDVSKLVSQTRRIEDMQQTTVNWITPAEQTVLEIKWLLCPLMLMGRLEILSVLVLFTRSYWKDN